MARPSRRRVFCLEESGWDDRLDDRTSVLPVLELLERMGVIERYVHRHVWGWKEFENYIGERRESKGLRSFGTVYLAFHGGEEGLSVGDQTVDLNRLANLIGPLPRGVVHLGSCSVLSDKAAARRFLKQTGASALSGYRIEVEWLDSAALDTAWLGYVAEMPIRQARRDFSELYASVIAELDWDIVTA